MRPCASISLAYKALKRKNREMKQGKFITIEGQDGAGKTTNINAICSQLDELGIEYIQTREPGGTPLSEDIRQLLLEKKNLKIDDTAELLLMFAARSQHLSELIEPTLKKGTWVVCDRFTDATIAYQGGGRGINESIINQLSDIVQQGRQPDLTVLLDVDLNMSKQRVNTRQEEQDRFETEIDDFKQRVRNKYLQLAQENPNRITLIDATPDIETVTNSVKMAIKSFCAKNDMVS